jgi:hypothetical protein
MDTVHTWILWRLLLIALIAFPFLVAAVVVGFWQRRTNATDISDENVDESVCPAIARPSAWRTEGEGRVEMWPVDGAAVVEKRAA